MNRSHLLPATLLALAAVAIAQSTQNQSNIARLVNVINQVTAKVDGVIPLREHVTIQLASMDIGCDATVDVVEDYIIPAGYSAEIRGVAQPYVGKLWMEVPGFAEPIPIHEQGGNSYPNNRDARGLVLPAGARIYFLFGSCAEPTYSAVTLALEEI